MITLDSLALPYSFNIQFLDQISPTVNRHYSVHDIDGDHKDEIITVTNLVHGIDVKGICDIYSFYPKEIRMSQSFADWLEPPSFWDINNDGRKEIMLTTSNNEESNLYIYDLSGKLLDKRVIASNPNLSKREWYCSVAVANTFDKDRDGWQELLITVKTGSAYQPRGVCMYDVRKDSMLWNFSGGFQPCSVILQATGSSAIPDILIGTDAPENGAGTAINGTDDLHTYLVRLNLDGFLLRCQPIRDFKFAKLELLQHDLTGDLEPEILLRYESHNAEYDDDFIGGYDAKTSIIGKKIVRKANHIIDYSFLDWNEDGVEELVLIWDDGLIGVFDGQLASLYEKQLTDFMPHRLLTDDVNLDNRKECLIAGYCGDQYYILLADHRFNPLAVHSIAAPSSTPSLLFYKNGYLVQKRFLLVANNRVYYYQPLRRNGTDSVHQRWRTLLTPASIFLFIFVLIGLLVYRRNDILRLVYQRFFDAFEEPLCLIKKDKVILLNTAWRRQFHLEYSDWLGQSLQQLAAATWPDNGQNPNFSDIAFSDLAQDLNKTLPATELLPEITIRVKNFPILGFVRKFRLIILKLHGHEELSKQALHWAALAQRLAHEIKTPLSTILLSVQHLELDLAAKTDEVNVSDIHIQRIYSQSDRIRQLTDTLIKFARLENPNKILSDLNELVEAFFADSITPRQIQLVKHLAHSLPEIYLDPQQIRLVLENIIQNAYKAIDDRPGTITISTRLAQNLFGSGQFLQIEISDTGKGIPTSMMANLFQPFFSRTEGGTGLGLTIVQKIISDHKGSIRVNSKEGLGTTIYIDLPL